MKKILAIAVMALMFAGCQGVITGHDYNLTKINQRIVVAGKVIDGVAGIVENGKGIYFSDTVQSLLSNSTKAKISEIYTAGKDYYETRNKVKAVLKEALGDVITVSEDENSSYISTASGE